MAATSYRLARVHASLFATLLFLAVTFLPRDSHSQPTPAYGTSYVRTGLNFFVLGGTTSTTGASDSQAYVLDLSTSWPTGSAPWKVLSSKYAFSSSYAISMPDNKTLLLFNVNTRNLVNGGAPLSAIYEYNIQANNWSNTTTVQTRTVTVGTPATIDPNTGQVYFASDRQFNIYNSVTNSWNMSVIPAGILTQQIYPGAVYNSARRSLMYMAGGGAGWESQTYITEYSIESPGWAIYVCPLSSRSRLRIS
jgi:hypothetical protein